MLVVDPKDLPRSRVWPCLLDLVRIHTRYPAGVLVVQRGHDDWFLNRATAWGVIASILPPANALAAITRQARRVEEGRLFCE